MVSVGKPHLNQFEKCKTSLREGPRWPREHQEGVSQGSLGPQAPWCSLEPPGSLPQIGFTLLKLVKMRPLGGYLQTLMRLANGMGAGLLQSLPQKIWPLLNKLAKGHPCEELASQEFVVGLIEKCSRRFSGFFLVFPGFSNAPWSRKRCQGGRG